MATSPAEKLELFRCLGAGPHHRIATPLGPVTLTDLAVTVDDETGAVVVDVQAEGYPDPHIRVINPPRYIPDPAGDMEVLVAGRVHRFRDDPLAALAHAIAQHSDPRGSTLRRGA